MQGYSIGCHRATEGSVLNAHQLESLRKLMCCSTQPARNGSRLNGRAAVTRGEVPGIGRVVVKHFMRGGLLRHLVERLYLRWGPVRSEQEFELLERVRALGVRAPEPVACGFRGGLFYRTWLVTKEIAHSRSLADLSQQDEDLAREYMRELINQVGILIRNNLLHVDLHPGNVLISDEGKLYILDFDKAREFKGPKNKLRDVYLHRWRRAVIKHKLPEILTEIMALGLRSSFE